MGTPTTTVHGFALKLFRIVKITRTERESRLNFLNRVNDEQKLPSWIGVICYEFY